MISSSTVLGTEYLYSYSFFFKVLFIHLRERAQVGVEAEGVGEADSPLSREQDMGLDPRTSRSRGSAEGRRLTI